MHGQQNIKKLVLCVIRSQYLRGMNVPMFLSKGQ